MSRLMNRLLYVLILCLSHRHEFVVEVKAFGWSNKNDNGWRHHVLQLERGGDDASSTTTAASKKQDSTGNTNNGILLDDLEQELEKREKDDEEKDSTWIDKVSPPDDGFDYDTEDFLSSEDFLASFQKEIQELRKEIERDSFRVLEEMRQQIEKEQQKLLLAQQQQEKQREKKQSRKLSKLVNTTTTKTKTKTESNQTVNMTRNESVLVNVTNNKEKSMPPGNESENLETVDENKKKDDFTSLSNASSTVDLKVKQETGKQQKLEPKEVTKDENITEVNTTIATKTTKIKGENETTTEPTNKTTSIPAVQQKQKQPEPVVQSEIISSLAGGIQSKTKRKQKSLSTKKKKKKKLAPELDSVEVAIVEKKQKKTIKKKNKKKATIDNSIKEVETTTTDVEEKDDTTGLIRFEWWRATLTGVAIIILCILITFALKRVERKIMDMTATPGI